MTMDDGEVQGLTEKLLAFGETLPPGQRRIFWEMLDRAAGASAPTEDSAGIEMLNGEATNER